MLAPKTGVHPVGLLPAKDKGCETTDDLAYLWRCQVPV